MLARTIIYQSIIKIINPPIWWLRALNHFLEISTVIQGETSPREYEENPGRQNPFLIQFEDFIHFYSIAKFKRNCPCFSPLKIFAREHLVDWEA